MPTRSKGNLKCNDEKSLHASNSCPKYVILSTLDLTIALGTILPVPRRVSDAIRGVGDRTNGIVPTSHPLVTW